MNQKIRIGIGFGGGRLGLPSPEGICTFAEKAEALGIDSIWLSDRVTSAQPQLDIACVMATIAARTKRIKMGPSVLTLPARDPVLLARTYATLDYLSGGKRRIIMAVGLGSDPRDCLACGIPANERAARMAESVEVLRKLWSESKVTHHGRFYHFDQVTVEPRPTGGPLDIWVGGRTEAALRRVAEYGDGWFPSFISPEEFRAGMQKLPAMAAAHQRTIEPGEAGVVLLTYVTEDHDQAEALLQLAAPAAKLSTDELRRRSAVGSPAACLEVLHRYIEAGCSKFVLFPLCPPDQLDAQIELYAHKLIRPLG